VPKFRRLKEQEKEADTYIYVLTSYPSSNFLSGVGKKIGG
jgi:hypothetical protein